MQPLWPCFHISDVGRITENMCGPHSRPRRHSLSSHCGHHPSFRCQTSVPCFLNESFSSDVVQVPAGQAGQWLQDQQSWPLPLGSQCGVCGAARPGERELGIGCLGSLPPSACPFPSTWFSVLPVAALSGTLLLHTLALCLRHLDWKLTLASSRPWPHVPILTGPPMMAVCLSTEHLPLTRGRGLPALTAVLCPPKWGYPRERLYHPRPGVPRDMSWVFPFRQLLES